MLPPVGETLGHLTIAYGELSHFRTFALWFQSSFKSLSQISALYFMHFSP